LKTHYRLNYPIKKGDKIEGFRDVDLIKTFRDENGALKSSSQLDKKYLMPFLEPKI
jgi:hypothetical protein